MRWPRINNRKTSHEHESEHSHVNRMPDDGGFVGVSFLFALPGMPTNYGNKIEIWAKVVDDIGIAERYMEQLAEDKDRGSMAWRCWQIGGYRCGNITRQAFDAARGEGHFFDLIWGGFPGADAPSIGTDKTTWTRKSE